MKLDHCWYRSPLGWIALSFQESAIVGLHFLGQKHLPAHLAYATCESEITGSIVDGTLDSNSVRKLRELAETQLTEYFLGTRKCFEVPFRFEGTAFQTQVWKRLLDIPLGAQKTYGEIAREMGIPNASRAVGSAIGRNPISLMVPCHRVVGSTGKLTGYAGGMDRKSWMLRHEQSVQSGEFTWDGRNGFASDGIARTAALQGDENLDLFQESLSVTA